MLLNKKQGAHNIFSYGPQHFVAGWQCALLLWGTNQKFTKNRDGQQSLTTQFFMNTKQVVKELSERELEVLRFSADGYSLKEIADLLTISVDTVDSRSRSVVDKLNARNMKHAIATALRNKIIK